MSSYAWSSFFLEMVEARLNFCLSGRTAVDADYTGACGRRSSGPCESMSRAPAHYETGFCASSSLTAIPRCCRTLRLSGIHDQLFLQSPRSTGSAIRAA